MIRVPLGHFSSRVIIRPNSRLSGNIFRYYNDGIVRLATLSSPISWMLDENLSLGPLESLERDKILKRLDPEFSKEFSSIPILD